MFAMKKIYTLIISLLISVSIFGAFTGSGTAASPYSGGTLSGPLTWNPASDTIYVSGLLYIGAPPLVTGNLTISPGVFVLFTSATAGIKINKGSITADGTISERITFTADHDKDHNHGESGEVWNHIFYNAVTGTSLFDYCIFEYGDAGGDFYGGGFYIYLSNNVTISNCIIHNCSADYGGGIFIWEASPTVNNSIFYDNSNVAITLYTGTTTITNCTFVDNNTINDTEYGGIMIYDGVPVIKNCVLWNNMYNSSTEYDYSGGGTISYSAATQTISGTGMIDLTVANTGTWGPNFIDPTNYDYYITSLSPLIDAGTTGGPTLDYLGNSRLGTTDIGAYENQGLTWQGDDVTNPTYWDDGDNWGSGSAPANNEHIYIPSGLTYYPVSSGTSPQNYTIASGKIMRVEPGAQVTLGTLTNSSGTLTLESDATGIASLMLNTYTDNSGTENIELFITGGSSPDYKWHYVSSPVDNLGIATFTGTTTNLLKYDEGLVNADNASLGWRFYDGYDYLNAGPDANTFSVLALGKGYDLYNGSNYTFTLSGTFNTGSVSNISLAYNSGTHTEYPDIHGLNLLGNPFTCSLDWDVIDNTLHDSISKAIYYTKDNGVASWVTDVGTNGGTNIIPPMQGFFVKTRDPGTTITLPTNARLHDSQARYKSAETVPLVRLMLQNDLVKDETVIRMDKYASESFDNDFDAYKMMISNSSLLIWSILRNVKYSINGVPFPDEPVEIPLIINSPAGEVLKISATQLQGLENYDLVLKDLYQNFSIDLKEIDEYTFSADSGTFSDRFILSISKYQTGIDPVQTDNRAFNIFASNNILHISPVHSEWDNSLGNMKLYDLSGKLIMTANNIEWHKGETKEFHAIINQGIYLVEINSPGNRYIGKVVIQ